jgi:hypothetical protein
MAITMGRLFQKMSRPQPHRLHVQRPTKENEMENSKLNLVAFSWALSGALVVLLILCEAWAMILPGWERRMPRTPKLA